MNITIRFFFTIITCFVCNALVASDVDWVDLPQTDYQTIVGYPSPLGKKLTKLFDQYHAIPKDRQEYLSARISKLSEICDFFTTCRKQEALKNETHDLLRLLETNIKRKMNYLTQIQHILDNQLQENDSLKNYHNDFTDQESNTYTAIPMRNELTYSVKMKEFWGEFWLETLDPCHRRLSNYYMLWLTAKKENENIPPFFLWLEAQNLPKSVPIVHYLSGDERAARAVIVQDGLLVSPKDKKPLNYLPNKAGNLFVIDLKKNLYVEKSGDGIWHSSFTCGKPVLAAGQIVIKEGIITTIAFHSGHYMPSFSLYHQCIQLLKQMGANFGQITEIIYFQNRNKYRLELPSSTLMTSEDFNRALLDDQQRVLISTCEF